MKRFVTFVCNRITHSLNLINIQGFPYWEDGEKSSPLAKNLLIPPHLEKSLHQISILPHQRLIPPLNNTSWYSLIKTSFLIVVIAPVQFCFNFILFVHNFDFIEVQYSQNVAFSFEKGLHAQTHSYSDSHHSIKKSLPAKFFIPPPLNAIWKTLILRFIFL